MNAFIKKHDFNFIKRCLLDYNNALTECVDKNIIEANRIYIQNKIYNIFDNLTPEQKELITINITDSIQIEPYLNKLEQYVYGMDKITEDQIRKIFKKEKKLKMPSEELLNSKKVYLSWFDEATSKKFIVYKLNKKFVGMICRPQQKKTKNTHVCSLCNSVGDENEIAYVYSMCKTSGSKDGSYKSIGFPMCLDIEKCNNSITSVDKLESIIKEVNNIK